MIRTWSTATTTAAAATPAKAAATPPIIIAVIVAVVIPAATAVIVSGRSAAVPGQLALHEVQIPARAAHVREVHHARAAEPGTHQNEDLRELREAVGRIHQS